MSVQDGGEAINAHPGLLPAFFAASVFFVAVQAVGIHLSSAFSSTLAIQASETASATTLVLIAYLALFLTMATTVYALIKFDGEQLIHTVGLIITWYAVFAIGILISPTPLGGVVGAIGGVATATVLRFRPSRPVINSVGFLWAVATVAAVGLLLSPTVVSVLLILLATYDGFAVYVTGHMVAMRDIFDDIDLPFLIYLPLSISDAINTREEDTNHLAIGLGDFAVPSLLVVSAGTRGVGGEIVSLVPVVTGAIGILIALHVMLRYIPRNQSIPGLPALSTGVLVGYWIGRIAVSAVS